MTTQRDSDNVEKRELESSLEGKMPPPQESLEIEPSLSYCSEEGDEEEMENIKLIPPHPFQLRTKKTNRQKYLFFLSLISLIVGLVNVIIAKKRNGDELSLLGKDGNSHNIAKQNLGNDLILSCPANITKSANDKDALLTEFYDESNHENDNSITTSKKVNETQLKNALYDGWNHNYYELKKDLYNWKSEHFSSLKPGDAIFESGCGIGLNLLMTAEILKESANIENLKVYGIEYVPKSTIDANIILGQLLPTAGNATLGSAICKADATNLYFVPSNSFDLAFTGYIDPIQDPLDIGIELGRQVRWRDLCKDAETLTEDGKLDQAAVEDWYAQWVTELVRITKPGKPIIIEQVSLPTCQNQDDWGGVSKDWWRRSVKRYQWDIEEDSIIVKDFQLHKRYNVFMKKRDVKDRH